MWRNNMELTEALEKVLVSYRRYYNILRNDEVEPPFVAEALFRSHNEQYFLIKKAKVAEINSNEDVFFYTTEELNSETLHKLDSCAWERGLSRVKPDGNHRNSDVTLVIIAEHIDESTLKEVRKMKHYQSYRFGLHGWSNYRLVALELSTGKLAFNRQGQILKKLFRNITK